ncbi:MAG: ribonuclease HI family protein [Candidatus Doudnabacteria bacterium]|nr:ribonuclease HI family protein [Candidatus Doudnabacteria bacterium]
MHYLFTDGGSRGNPGNAATGYLLYNEKELVEKGGDFLGQQTNNFAEYTGLASGLRLALKHGVTELICKLDSELVVKQLNGQYKVKHPDIKPLHAVVKELAAQFKSVKFTHVLRAENKEADAIVNEVLDAV